MNYEVNLTAYQPSTLFNLGPDFTGTSPSGDRITFNNFYMERNDTPFYPVAGEFHYSRMSPGRWEDELIKMRMGGINVVSTYLFWNHIEETEGVFDFSGCRDLRRFVSLCGKHGLFVILRVGPFDHGEVRNGGLPDWLYGKPFEVRTTQEGFLNCVRRLYEKIGEQVKGLFFQDGGPVIGVQLDNEYMHSSAPWEMTTGISDEWVFGGDEGEAYILKLMDIARNSGLTPAFFTGTAWGGAAYSPKVLPLWGGYAYRPWIFYSHRGEHPATEEFIYEDYHRDGAYVADDFAPAYPPSSRPYACCEMGAGMMCCYYYRFIYPYRSVDALANIKLGSGCNFLGYYMFHGGTNPLGKNGAFLNESQVPKRSYDYQAALGEFGQLRESYRRLKSIHFFTRCFGSLLAPMETLLPEGASRISPEDPETLRFAVRTDGKSGFLFLNNFQDHRRMPEKRNVPVLIRTCDEEFRFPVSIASEENAILPFNLDLDGILLKQANAQPVLRTRIGGRITWVFLIPEGMDGSFRFEEGVEMLPREHGFTVRRKAPEPAGADPGNARERDVLLLTREEANDLFLLRDGSLVFTKAALLEDEQGRLRVESTCSNETLLALPPDRLAGSGAIREADRGPFGVWCVRTEEKNPGLQAEQTAQGRWLIRIPENAMEGLKDLRLQIDYRGDIGTLFLDGVMIHDHFCNGDTWEIGLREYRNQLKSPLVLKIAPLREGASVNVESAMAARNETVASAISELKDVRLRPVYEFVLK